MKPKGAKNITPFPKRANIETSADAEIRHLADISDRPLTQLERLYQHQENYLNWLDDRHERIIDLQGKLNAATGITSKKGPAGAKEATFEKYRWYAQQGVLLEAINAFELFYKRTFIGLAKCLHEYLDPKSLEDKIDMRLIWAMNGRISVSELLFEQKLFHNTEQVDEASHLLVGKRRYADTRLKDRVRVIRGIFQIRHTLSHNGGLVTQSDAGKFRMYGFGIENGEVIDPTKHHLRQSIFREIRQEAEEFTKWLITATVDYLISVNSGRGLVIPVTKRPDLRGLLGNAPKEWKRVPWV